MKLCGVAGCQRRMLAKDLCKLHYYRLRNTGSMGSVGPGRAARGSGGDPYVAVGKKREHVLVAERALGKALPKGAVVHHVNENGKDNRNSNLVICPSRSYHALLHQRMDALKACGNANWRKCYLCHQYDAPENLKHRAHRECHNAYNRNYTRARRTA